MEEINKERWSRSIALEHDYVHQVYERIGRDLEQAIDPLQNTIRKFLNELEPGSVVADIGCGDGRHWQDRDGLFCVGADNSLLQTTLSMQRCHGAIVGNTLQLPLRSSAFDAVLCVGVLHHLASRERRIQALRELARILRVGGRVLIAVRSHQRSQDVLMPWYDVKKKGERYQDEDSGEYDLEASDCDSISLSTSDDDEPSVGSATDKFVHTISPKDAQHGRTHEQKSRSLDGEDSHQEIRTNAFHDFVQTVLKRFSSDGSMLTKQQWSAPSSSDCGKDCKLESDAFSLPMSVQELVKENYIELRNIDEARGREDHLKKAEPISKRRRSLTDIFKNLWTPKSDLNTAMRITPLKRSMTTATCNSTFHTFLPLESIGEFDMTIGEADKIVNDFLDSSLSDGQDIQLHLSRFDDLPVVNESILSQIPISKCKDSNSSSLSCANKYSATNGGKKSQYPQMLNLPQKSHNDCLIEQELSYTFLKPEYIFENADFSKVRSNEHFEYRLGINELSDSTANQENFLPSLEVKNLLSDIHKSDLSKELNYRTDSKVNDCKMSVAHHKNVAQNNLELSKLLSNTKESLLKSRYYDLADSWEDGLSNCCLEFEENEISKSIREKMMFLQKQVRNSGGFSEMHSVVNSANTPNVIWEDCSVQKRISKSIDNFDEDFMKDRNLADCPLVFYSMPALHDFSSFRNSCSVFTYLTENKAATTDLIEKESRFRNGMNERFSEEWVKILDTWKSEFSNIDKRTSKSYRYPLHRSLTAVPLLKNLWSKNECRTNGVTNKDSGYILIPPTRKVSGRSSFSSFTHPPKKAFTSSFKRSQSFDRLNYSHPAEKAPDPKHSEGSTNQFGDGGISASNSSYYGNWNKENHRLNNKQANLNANLGNGNKYYSNKMHPYFPLSSASLQCLCLESTFKLNSSGTLTKISTEKDSTDKASDFSAPRIQCLNDIPDKDLNLGNEATAKGKKLSYYERKNSTNQLPGERCRDASHPDSFEKSEELLNRNSFLKHDTCQNLDASGKATLCISERGFNELTDCKKEDRTKQLFQPDKQSLIVNYSYGRIHENGATVVMHRYYHLFEKDELSILIEKYVSDLHILEYFQYQSHWCVIAEKVRVWTI